MDINSFYVSVVGFSDLAKTEQIKIFGWYLHHFRHQKYFTPTEVKKLFEDLNLIPPTNINAFLVAMVNTRPPEASRTTAGFALNRPVRDDFEIKYGQRSATIHVDNLLRDLPLKIPSLAKKDYLDEAMICFRHKAFRAAIVMCWNLSYDHLCEIVLAKYLVDFNSQLPKSFPRADISTIRQRDDFSELKESQVIHVCKSANIISGSMQKILKEKLDRRNIAAHPSGVLVSQLQAEEFITDLVENLVLKLS